MNFTAAIDPFILKTQKKHHLMVILFVSVVLIAMAATFLDVARRNHIEQTIAAYQGSQEIAWRSMVQIHKNSLSEDEYSYTHDITLPLASLMHNMQRLYPKRSFFLLIKEEYLHRVALDFLLQVDLEWPSQFSLRTVEFQNRSLAEAHPRDNRRLIQTLSQYPALQSAVRYGTSDVVYSSPLGLPAVSIINPIVDLQNNVFGYVIGYEETNQFYKENLTFWMHLLIAALLVFMAGYAWYVVLKSRLDSERQKQRLEAISDTMDEGMYVIDRAGVVIYANAAAERILEYPVSEMVGRNAHQLFCHNVDTELMACPIYQTIEINAPYFGENRYTRRDGSFIIARVATRPLLENESVVAAVTTFFDITEQQLTQKQLERSEQKLRLTFEAAAIGTWDWDIATGVIELDHCCYTILGYPDKAFVFSLWLWKEMVHPDNTESLFDQILRHVHAGEPFVVEFRLRCADGSWKWIQQRGRVVENTDATVTTRHVIGTIIDITERMEYEQALIIATQQAESANRVKSEFLANMSHEIRTPLNAILGLTEIGVDECAGKECHGLFEKIHSSSRLLLGILNDILDYSKIEAGKLEIEKRNFQLEEIIGQLTILFENMAASKNISLHFPDLRRLSRCVVGDSLRITQVLTNLLSNALKFTETGSVTLSIDGSGEGENYLLTFSVIDTGIGMDTAQVNTIFSPFSQADSSTTRRFGGTGLGLTISRKLVEAMGGVLSVVSEPGVGSTFTFTLPLPSEVCTERRTFKVAEVNTFDTLKGIRVLLVEDNELNQRVASRLLQRKGILVTTASNGKDAVAMALANEFDLILMDLQMPIMDGYEAAKQIRKNNKHVPIIALTAATLATERQKVIDSGMDDHLAKPINSENMFKVLTRWTTKEA
ncbi:hybrid sensor histidine kinase/response regulator [Chrysiogenes arsenatis]|uniref:hybrid sensor histidine kinase/response regulator n=1 Tax=Chrysiogenes arsenatis TaxID=309797 RepID=UPI00040EE177|nr:PAS domain-containing hybrid sensor histidine kinase/response regulator [Chrysiogenes arsenatis]